MLVIKNFFDEKLLQDVVNFYKTASMETVRVGHTNIAWSKGVVGHSALNYVIPAPQFREPVRNIFNKLGDRFNSKKISTNVVVFGKGCYIPFHDDHSYHFAATLYLNDKWNIEDGGLFIYKDKPTNEYKVIVPEKNMCVINTEKEVHHVSMVNYFASQNRITMQIWGVND